MALNEKFSELFSVLKDAAYVQRPRTPQELLKLRGILKNKALQGGAFFDPFEVCFNLGSYASYGMDLQNWWLGSPELLDWILKVRPAVSNLPLGENLYVCHEHWPPRSRENPEFVYFGRETERLLVELESLLSDGMQVEYNKFTEIKNVLDLGCGAGALSLYWLHRGASVHAVDVSAKSTAWTEANVHAQLGELATRSLHTICADVTQPGFLYGQERAGGFDAVVFNPPMVLEEQAENFVGSPNKETLYPHRNGGHLGIFLQDRFLDVAGVLLRKKGHVFALATNPILKNGDAPFARSLEMKPFLRKKYKVLDPFFNQAKYQDPAYVSQKIKRVELLFLWLTKI